MIERKAKKSDFHWLSGESMERISFVALNEHEHERIKNEWSAVDACIPEYVAFFF